MLYPTSRLDSTSLLDFLVCYPTDTGSSILYLFIKFMANNNRYLKKLDFCDSMFIAIASWCARTVRMCQVSKIETTKEDWMLWYFPESVQSSTDVAESQFLRRGYSGNFVYFCPEQFILQPIQDNEWSNVNIPRITTQRGIQTQRLIYNIN